jgi:hypothetical protein
MMPAQQNEILNRLKATAELAKPVIKQQNKNYTRTEMRSWLSGHQQKIAEKKFTCLVLGADGTGKSPLCFAALSDEDIKNGYRMVVIDLDGGCEPLLTHNAKRCRDAGREPSDVFWIRNPIVIEYDEEESIGINYIKTFEHIRGAVQEMLAPVSETDKTPFWEANKIKVFVFDGLSTALKYAESQMRIEKEIAPDGGVSTRFWLIRNKLFLETLEIIKSLPFSTFFVAHEDFDIRNDTDAAAVKIKTNALCHQKILCKKVVAGKETRFEAQILKSKYDVKLEGKMFIFAKVNNETGQYEWKPEQVLVGL